MNPAWIAPENVQPGDTFIVGNPGKEFRLWHGNGYEGCTVQGGSLALVLIPPTRLPMHGERTLALVPCANRVGYACANNYLGTGR